jgi:hypothetical protein
MDLDKQLEEAQNAAAEEEEADKGQSEETEKPVDEEPPVEEETNDENHDETVRNCLKSYHVLGRHYEVDSCESTLFYINFVMTLSVCCKYCHC